MILMLLKQQKFIVFWRSEVTNGVAALCFVRRLQGRFLFPRPLQLLENAGILWLVALPPLLSLNLSFCGHLSFSDSDPPLFLL